MLDQDLCTFTCRQSVVYCGLDDGLALLDTESNVYFSLNETGSLIWEYLGAGLSGPMICEKLAERFEADSVDISQDVDDLTAQLLSANLIERTERPERTGA